jgi:hypothetical protein
MTLNEFQNSFILIEKVASADVLYKALKETDEDVITVR